MDATTIATVILSTGAVSTALTGLVKAHVPDRFRALAALAIAFLVGVVASLIAWAYGWAFQGGSLSWASLLAVLIATAGSSQALYTLATVKVGAAGTSLASLLGSLLAALAAKLPSTSSTAVDLASGETVTIDKTTAIDADTSQS